MKNTVLLIGNDINNTHADSSWKNLLTSLLDFSEVRNEVSIKNKPFPLLYEEIFLWSAREHDKEESVLKEFIAKQVNEIEPNDIHREILKLGVQNILTTNYDQAFEKVLSNQTQKLKNEGVIKESLFSLFRKNRVNEMIFWHIHGTALTPKTITLGYEHYGGYLQQMRSYVVTGTKTNYKKDVFDPIHKRLKYNKIGYDSWIDFFFTHDIEIFGLNLDFVEMHLWWLLTYRAKSIVTQRIDISNEIRYYYPENLEEESKQKLELFKAVGVQTIAIPMKGEDKTAYYKKVIKRIKENGTRN